MQTAAPSIAERAAHLALTFSRDELTRRLRNERAAIRRQTAHLQTVQDANGVGRSTLAESLRSAEALKAALALAAR